MKTVHLFWEERYPFYGLVDDPSLANRDVELTDEDYEFVKKAMADFERAQEILENAGVSKPDV